jgi:hypothetical protein
MEFITNIINKILQQIEQNEELNKSIQTFIDFSNTNIINCIGKDAQETCINLRIKNRNKLLYAFLYKIDNIKEPDMIIKLVLVILLTEFTFYYSKHNKKFIDYKEITHDVNISDIIITGIDLFTNLEEYEIVNILKKINENKYNGYVIDRIVNNNDKNYEKFQLSFLDYVNTIDIYNLNTDLKEIFRIRCRNIYDLLNYLVDDFNNINSNDYCKYITFENYRKSKHVVNVKNNKDEDDLFD